MGKNCVAAMKFEISGFYSSGGQASAQTGPGPFKFFSGGAFQPQGASLGQILIL